MDHASSITFNKLCSLCKQLFSNNTSQRYPVHPFHSFEGLQECARRSCHLCNALMSSARFCVEAAFNRANWAAEDFQREADGRPALQVDLKAQLFRHSNSLRLSVWFEEELEEYPEGFEDCYVEPEEYVFAEIYFLPVDGPGRSREQCLNMKGLS